MKAALWLVAEDVLDAAGEVPTDVEAAADLAARPEARLWPRGIFQTTPPRFEPMAPLDRLKRSVRAAAPAAR
ncbi:MAG TPA: hypothetical protein VGE72_19640 [Azospirillum sp.]